jgi:hypothetical protein
MVSEAIHKQKFPSRIMNGIITLIHKWGPIDYPFNWMQGHSLGQHGQQNLIEDGHNKELCPIS